MIGRLVEWWRFWILGQDRPHWVSRRTRRRAREDYERERRRMWTEYGRRRR